jgi:hypothetical protein
MVLRDKNDGWIYHGPQRSSAAVMRPSRRLGLLGPVSVDASTCWCSNDQMRFDVDTMATPDHPACGALPSTSTHCPTAAGSLLVTVVVDNATEHRVVPTEWRLR